jgi:hypothetical protein
VLAQLPSQQLESMLGRNDTLLEKLNVLARSQPNLVPRSAKALLSKLKQDREKKDNKS